MKIPSNEEDEVEREKRGNPTITQFADESGTGGKVEAPSPSSQLSANEHLRRFVSWCLPDYGSNHTPMTWCEFGILYNYTFCLHFTGIPCLVKTKITHVISRHFFSRSFLLILEHKIQKPWRHFGIQKLQLIHSFIFFLCHSISYGLLYNTLFQNHLIAIIRDKHTLAI